MMKIIDNIIPLNAKRKELDKMKKYYFLFDGNIILYSAKEVLIEFTPHTVANYLETLLEEYYNPTKIIVFDGMPPLQKIPEQLRRRKRKYNNLSDMNIQLSFDLANQAFITFLDEIEVILTNLGWIVYNYNIDGEGEQKIASIMRIYLQEDISRRFICWTKDWDMLIILINLNIGSNKVYLKMFMNTMPYFLDINKCIDVISGITTIVNFSAIILLFGCDFYPGINNLPLTIQSVKRLLDSKIFAYESNGFILINKKRFNHAILMLKDYCFTTNEDNSSASSISSTSDVNSLLLIGYSNVTPTSLEHIQNSSEYRGCNNNCLTCQPMNYCSKRTMVKSANEYLTMYLWTLNYFVGKLDKIKVKNSKTTYTSYISPVIDAIIKADNITYEIISQWHIDIVKIKDYNKLIEDGLLLNYKIIPACNNKNTFGEITILTKELCYLSALTKD